MSTLKTPSAHIYSPMMPRLSAFIIGDRSALLQIRSAIDEALVGAPEQVGMAKLTDASGSPYFAIVCLINSEQADKLPPPYIDPAYRDPDADFTALEGIPRITRRLVRHRNAIKKAIS